MLKKPGDGSVTFHTEENGNPFKIKSDGMILVGNKVEPDVEGVGIALCGHTALLSRFKNGYPTTPSVSLKKGNLSYAAVDGIDVSHDLSELADVITRFSEEHNLSAQDDKYLEFFRELSSEPVASPKEWDDFLPPHMRVAGIVVDHSISLDSLLYYVGSLSGRRVMLHAIPKKPPSGMIEIAAGVKVKESGTWLRRVDRLLSLIPDNYYIPMGLGFVKIVNEWYFVSAIPENVMSEDITLLSCVEITSDEFALEISVTVSECVDWVHCHGLTFNGFLNPRSFMVSSNGRLFLNMGYVFTSTHDRSELYGALDDLEIEYTAPSGIRKLSPMMEKLVNFLGYAPDRTKPKQEDLFSLGMILYRSGSRATRSSPYGNTSEYVAKSIALGNKHDGSPWILHLHQGAGDEIIDGEKQSDKQTELIKSLIEGRSTASQAAVFFRALLEQTGSRDVTSALRSDIHSFIGIFSGALKSGQYFMSFQ
jgi:hypothetical protein